MNVRLIATALLLPLALSGFARAGEDYAHRIQIEGSKLQVDLAMDDAARMRGLMFRDSMPARSGMLFVFETSQPLAFWMRNTRIPLDIIYFGSDGKLVSVQHAPPCRTAECPTFPSEGEAQYVVELNRGEAAELGLQPGDQLCTDERIAPGLPACQ